MNLAGGGSVLDESYKHWQVSDVTCIFHDELDLFKNLEDIGEEELGSVCCDLTCGVGRLGSTSPHSCRNIDNSILKKKIEKASMRVNCIRNKRLSPA